MDEMTRKLVGLYKKANNAVESGVDKLCDITRITDNTPWPDSAYNSYLDLIAMFFQ